MLAAAEVEDVADWAMVAGMDARSSDRSADGKSLRDTIAMSIFVGDAAMSSFGVRY